MKPSYKQQKEKLVLDEVQALNNKLDSENIEFKRVEAVLHGEYLKSLGEVIDGDGSYEVRISERDESYNLQIRRGQEVLVNEYIDSENPREEIPVDEDELYRFLTNNEIY